MRMGYFYAILRHLSIFLTIMSSIQHNMLSLISLYLEKIKLCKFFLGGGGWILGHSYRPIIICVFAGLLQRSLKTNFGLLMLAPLLQLDILFYNYLVSILLLVGEQQNKLNRTDKLKNPLLYINFVHLIFKLFSKVIGGLVDSILPLINIVCECPGTCFTINYKNV